MHEAFMGEAIRLALESVANGNGGPFGAVVVKDGRIVGRGTNGVTRYNDPTAHAEVMAIRDACRQLGEYHLTGCELYVSCMPCPMCLSASYWARIERIYYAARAEDAAAVGFDDVLIAEELGLPLDKRRLPLVHMPTKDALAPLRLWHEKDDKIPY
ncbi:MAG: nucleoside deaminase [Thiohalomonadaceae bacterium]